jgi:hypothetical protein
MKCICIQKPELRQTGLGPPAADLYCPVCSLVFWTYKDGSISKERPTEWPTNKKEKIQTWELKRGGWISFYEKQHKS